MINTWLESLSVLIKGSIWLGPVLAIIAGMLTSFTPCSLSSVPLIVAFVGGSASNEPKKSLRLSLVFALGMAVTFTVLGVIASLVGGLMGRAFSWWYIILGILMILMALQTWEVFNFIPSTFLVSKNTKKGFIGAFVAGILGGIFSSPCATPVLVVLLALVAAQGKLVWGIFLLLLFSLGHSVLVLIAGTSIGFVKKITSNQKYGRASKIIKIALGILIMLLAFYMFYLGF